MQAFFFRLLALAIRFICPIAALALSDAEVMGSYYLFISYFTFVVGISSLELAMPFSRQYLRCKTDRQRRLMFSGFLTTQVAVISALAIPAGIVVASLAGVPIALVPLFCLTLATEACVNETGRFFWNIGEWKMPSLRDLARAAIFSSAIVLSVYSAKTVLTSMTFLILSAGNLAIIGLEWTAWGGAVKAKGSSILRFAKSTRLRVRRSLAGSVPQFVQMQLLGLLPLLERIFIERTLGLATLASFSFITSVMQSAASLQLVPLVARARQLMLGARSTSEQVEANKHAVLLGLKIAAICGGWAVIVYTTLPMLGGILGKDLIVFPILLMVAYVSSVSAIFCSAVAPIFTVKGEALRANILTALAMGIFPIGYYLVSYGTGSELSLLPICGVAASQLIFRISSMTRILVNRD